MSDVKLMPCPNPFGYDDSDGHEVNVVFKPYPFTRVECSCGIQGPMRLNREDAITVWNTRQPSPALAVAVEALEEIWNWTGNETAKEALAKIKVC